MRGRHLKEHHTINKYFQCYTSSMLLDLIKWFNFSLYSFQIYRAKFFYQ